ncbi:MAG: colanic acid biosynthesis glycosyltransferase WcaI [Candidatus Parabeggiatoa sp. nov. 1]|nr:MAG: colanic acid biosynthesis glycosyltransferase WcaI [Gammaproteobacteria bacterium]
MKILIQAINYPPESIGTGKYTGEMAEWLAARGHEVTVITAPPYYPQWKVWPKYSVHTYAREKIRNVRVIRCPLWVPAKPSGLKRIMQLLSFVISAAPVVFWKIVRQRPDMVIVIHPYLFAGLWVQLFSRLSKNKTWLHIQDYEIDAAFELGFFKLTYLRWFATQFESRLLRSFDRASTISARMMERLKMKGVKPENIVFFPNWVDTHTIFPIEGTRAFRIQFGLSTEHFVGLYSGNMGVKQGLDLIINAAKQLKDNKRIVFVLCGDGAMLENLINEAKGLDNIKFIPLQPYKQLNELLNMADVHLLPQREDVADLVMPSKLSGMLASGRPILATASLSTQIADTVKNAGLVVPPGDVGAFVEALLVMESSAEKRNEWGKRAREIAVQEWDKEQILLKFEQNLLDCI